MIDARQGTELLARLIATRRRPEAPAGAPYGVAVVEVRARGRELVLCDADGGRLAGAGPPAPPPAFCALQRARYAGDPPGPADAAATVELVREWLEAGGSEVRFVERSAADAAAARAALEGLRGGQRPAPPPASPRGDHERANGPSDGRAADALARAGEPPGADGLAAEAEARHRGGGPDDGPVPHFPVMLADAVIAFGRVDVADGAGGRVKVEVLKHRGPGPRPGPVYLGMGVTAVDAADRVMAILAASAARKAYSGPLPGAPAAAEGEPIGGPAEPPPGGDPARLLPVRAIPPGRGTAFGAGWLGRQDGQPRGKALGLPPGVREAWEEGWDAREAAVSEGWLRPGLRGGEGEG